MYAVMKAGIGAYGLGLCNRLQIH